MKLSRCPNQNCESLKSPKGSSFTMTKANFGSNSNYLFVQCSSCGTVVGIVNKYSNEVLLNGINNLPDDPFNTSLLQNSDNFDKIMNELISQSEAIKAIMKRIDI